MSDNAPDMSDPVGDVAISAHADSRDLVDSARLILPDVAKILAITAVVVTHVASPTNEHFGTVGRATWIGSTVLMLSSRWAVPVFVMVSGMLLLTERTARMPAAEFYRRRATRIAIPAVFWIVFYRLYLVRTGTPSSATDHVKAILSGQPYYHLYFLFIIAGLYVACPYLARVLVSMTDRQARNLSIAALAFGAAWAGVPPWLDGTGGSAFTMWVPWTGYFVAGSYLGRLRTSRRRALASATGFLLLVSAASAATYLWVSRSGPAEGRRLYEYLGVPVVVMSSWVFVALQGLCSRWTVLVRTARYATVLRTLGNASFGVYLVHPFFLTEVLRTPPGVPQFGAQLAWWLPATVLGLLVVSFATTLVLQRIPVLRRIV